MPYQDDGVRNYRKQYDKYDGKPEQVKNRAKRNAARAMLAKEGVVKKGDGKDVDHKKALSKGGGNGRSNLKAVPAAKNKSFARKSNGAMK
jgi:hypothetical protein